MSTTAGKDQDWWRGSVIYQIYLRSFQDSDGDGVGDLPGITRRLDYVASLGVDAIWITPFFASPMKDFGYDVSDYRAIDPLFGNMADLDQLLKRAHQLGLKVIIDMVLSHSSDQHPWFRQSRANRINPKADWYVWADPQPDGTAPNNWLSIFGGSAWQWEPRREQYYLHNFLSSQPDFNFHCRDVQDALLDVIRFWLDKGVDGFRLDTINFYIHDKELRSNPPLPAEKRNASIAPRVNPYNYQEHIYSKNRPENLEFLQRLRRLLDQYHAPVTLGEIGDALRGIEILGEYTERDKRVHMCYAFEFLAQERISSKMIAQVFARIDKSAALGWACWAFSNHDVVRSASRWQLSQTAQRCYTSLLLCLRGSVCIYQGEELGFEEANIPLERLQDPYGIEFWPEFKGRDGCRTPMLWKNDASTNAGFSRYDPWLPIDTTQLNKAVAAQITNSNSLYHHYKDAISLRHRYPALVKGEQTLMQAQGDLLTFVRTLGNEELFLAFNLGEGNVAFSLPEGKWCAPAVIPNGAVAPPNNLLGQLQAWQYCIASKGGS